MVEGRPAPFAGDTIQVGALDAYEAWCRAATSLVTSVFRSPFPTTAPAPDGRRVRPTASVGDDWFLFTLSLDPPPLAARMRADRRRPCGFVVNPKDAPCGCSPAPAWLGARTPRIHY